MVYKISKKPSADGQELEERHVFATVKTVNSQFARGQATFELLHDCTLAKRMDFWNTTFFTCVFCCYCKAIMKMVLKMQWGALNVGDCWWWLMMDLWPKLWSIHNGFVFTWKLCLSQSFGFFSVQALYRKSVALFETMDYSQARDLALTQKCPGPWWTPKWVENRC